MGNLALAFMDSGLGKLSVKKLNLFIPAAETVEITTEGGVAPEITVDNGSLQLVATVSPEEASQEVVWSITEGETFAIIDQNGLLTATASNAVVTVKAHSAENSSIFDTIDVNLTNQQSEVEAESLTVSTLDDVYPDIFEIGGTLQLLATVLPAEADQYVTWTVEEGSDVVSVDENGLVTGWEEGFAIIRATHEDGVLSDEIRVNVWENGCSQGHESMIFGLGYNITKNNGAKGADDFVVESGVQFELGTVRLSVISPANVDLTSFDLKIFKNKHGEMPGEEIITLTNLVPSSQKFVRDWDFGQFQYEVELNLPETLTLSQGTYWMQPLATAANGGSVYWDITVYGTIGGDYQIDYLDGNGWRKLADGGFDAVFDVSGNCTLMPVLITTVDGTDASVLVGETLALQAEVFGTENQEVIWSITEGEDLITIDENGLVTGVEVGVATVRATSVENDAYDEIDVTVVSPIACMQEVLGNGHEDGYATSTYQMAVDIDVPEGTEFVIYKVKPITINYSTAFQFKFYSDDEGLPGSELFTVDGTIIDDISTGS